MAYPQTRHEVHYGSRMVRAFVDRPAHIDAMFQAAVAASPERDAIVMNGERLSYAALDARVEAVAANLVAQGLGKGDRVALLLDNGFAFLECVLAAARAGLIVVPMNTRQRRPEIEFVLNQCRAAALVYDADHVANLPTEDAVPDLRARFVVGQGPDSPYEDLARPAAAASFPQVAEDDVFCLLYTSGTTGRPKGAKLTHFSTIHSTINYASALALTPADVGLLAVPASHVTGLVAVLLTMIRAGGTTVMLPAFKARHFLEVAARERATFTIMVPAMYNLCLLDPDFAGFDLSHWRIAGFGGAPMPQATIDRLTDTAPSLNLVNCYGSTETTSPATILPVGDIAAHPKSVGRPVAGCDILIVDEHGREVAPGESGELMIAGAMVVPGYWENPEADAAGFIDGYWVSGDVGSVDAEGYVHVFDRKKDMINRAGFKVYCIEVESVLSRHPAVIESAVVGRPDPVLGEKVHAFIVARPGAADTQAIRAYCAERLSDYKVPDAITFLEAPLPRNPNGKILKTSLRQMLPADDVTAAR
jgi:long-chain acyl-CoA synthetase